MQFVFLTDKTDLLCANIHIYSSKLSALSSKSPYDNFMTYNITWLDVL